MKDAHGRPVWFFVSRRLFLVVGPQKETASTEGIGLLAEEGSKTGST
jgi:hypothetical protein